MAGIRPVDGSFDEPTPSSDQDESAGVPALIGQEAADRGRADQVLGGAAVLRMPAGKRLALMLGTLVPTMRRDGKLDLSDGEAELLVGTPLSWNYGGVLHYAGTAIFLHSGPLARVES